MAENYVSEGLRQPGEDVEYTSKEAIELAKCMEDPIYFIKNYIKIVHLDKGLTKFNMYPFQEDIVNIMHENRHVILKLPRQSGKCLKSSTYVTLRNKSTGEIEKIEIGNFFLSVKCIDKA